MRILPGSGYTCSVATSTDCAELVFNVQVVVPDTYYVHVRMLATGANDNSLYYGLDGTPETVELSPPTNSTWVWQSGASFALAAGPHTLNLWQRESGARADVVALTRSPTPPP
jgi:hypothetical protein